MIQSFECAYFDGAYMAVTGYNGDTVKLTDSNKYTYDVDRKKAGIIPINGALTALYFADASSRIISRYLSRI